MDRKQHSQEMANGNLLRYYKHQFLVKKNRDALLAVLACLRDSQVIVPVKASFGKEDEARIKAAPKGEVISSKKNLRMQPDLLTSDDGTFFPIFSDLQQLPAEYAEQFSTVTLPAVHCIEMALSIKDISGLVLDAFTEAMLIPKASAALIPKMKSHLK